MPDERAKCPSCDASGEVGDACEGKACQKRGYHFIPESFWERAHTGKDPQPDPLIGQLIGDFLVVDMLGVGGFGKVCLALQSPIFRLRGALKLIEFPNDNEEFQEALLAKFQGEAEVLAELTHPNIVRLLKYGIHRQRPYLVMEFLEKGLTFRDEIYNRARADEAFSQRELRHIFHQLLNGLEAAHGRNIIHRDLKPENIMLQQVVGNPYLVRILDFGIAKFVEGRSTTKWPLGSPSYMAPEQISLKGLGTWTDLYALGVMFFELVTGRRPFPGDTDEAIMAKKLTDDFDPFEQIDDLDIPEATVGFMRRAIAAEPENRHENVAEFREDLDLALDTLEGRDGDLGPGGRSLTLLLKSKDIIEVPGGSGGRPSEPSEPPKLPDGADERRQQVPDSGGLGKVVLVGLIAGLLTVGAFLASDYLGESPAGAADAADSAEHTVATVPPDAAVDDAGPGGEAGADASTGDAALVSAPGPGADGGHTRGDSDGGDARSEDVAAPVPDDAVVGLSAGKFHTCALRADGDFRCWGANFNGELGLGHTRKIGDDEPANSVDPIGFDRPVDKLVAAGDREASFTCALLEGGSVRCFGANKHGQLGYGHTRRLGDDETLDSLEDIQLGAKATDIAIGASKFGSHGCAVLEGGALRCWGSGKFGKLGYGHTNVIGDDELPTTAGTVPVGGKVAQVAAGKYNTCAIMQDGSLRCWGWNKVGQLGLGHTRDIGDNEIPASVAPIELGAAVEQVSVGRRHICAVLADDSVRCWGWNNQGQLGLGHTENIGDDELPMSVEPVELSGPAVQVVTGSLHSCALLENGRVQCWGDNKFGQLGYGHTNDVGDLTAPTAMGTVGLGTPAVGLAAGSYHTCALLEGGSVRCWGYNDHGQLGYGHTHLIGDDESLRSVADVPVR